MAKSNFDHLLQRYLEGNVSEQERIKIEAWLDENKSNAQDLNLNQNDEEKIFQRITATINQQATQLPKPKRNSTMLLRMAATLCLLITASALVWLYNHQGPGVQDPSIASEKMILNDGTLVWLEHNSKLFYYERPGDANRYAELIGEGLFEVTKDPTRPFIIKCGEIQLKVLGTSFIVNDYQDSVELTVLTGTVNISSKQNQAGQNITAQQKIMYAPNRENKPTNIAPEDAQALTANSQYNMHFANNTLAEVVKKMTEKFEVDITIQEKKMKACKLTADLTDHSLETTLETIGEILDVKYTITGNQVLITEGKCK
jgi:transmembrane sensor